MISGDGMPRAEKFSGSHEERRSVIAAFKKRFGAVFPENRKSRGRLSGVGETSSDSQRADGAMIPYFSSYCLTPNPGNLNDKLRRE